MKKKNPIFLLWALLTILISCYKAKSQECFKNSNSHYCKLSSATPYRFVANYNDSQLNFPGCVEKKMWILIRHGTRLPDKKYVRGMSDILPKVQKKIVEKFENGNSNLSHDIVKKISEWKLSFNTSRPAALAEEGENELIDLAERMQSRFPKLLPEDYNKELFKFKYTDSQRTEKSAKAFALGLFGQHQHSKVTFETPGKNDGILRFYKKCQRWVHEVKKNPKTYKERDLFIQSEIFQKALNALSERIGFEVDSETIMLIYKMCSFETAWNKTRNSPWCNILSIDEFKILEYAKDLKYYWCDGYGNRLNYEIACPAIRDMFNFFGQNDETLATAYFSHSGTILKMLSILGIAKDENTLKHNSFSISNSRNWKVSLIDAFASNIAFVLYECENKVPKVLLLHQERQIQFPGCPSEDLCPLSIVKDLLPDTEEECKFDAICSNTSK